MKSNRQKLVKKLDELCSLYVRNRDKKCILCGGCKDEIKKLQSHHWIVTRARSLKYRFDPRNCVSLCYGCHILKIHQQPTISLLEELKTRAILNNVCTPEDIEEIKSDLGVYKMSIAELEERIAFFEKELKK